MIVRKHLFEKAIELLGLFTVDASIALHIGDWRLPLWFNDWSLWMQDANGSLSSEKKVKVVFVLGEQKCINILSRVLSQLIICVSESNFRWMLRQQAKINHPNKLLQEKEKQLLVIDKKEPNVSIFLIDSFGDHS